MPPLVSVIVNNYNYDRYLARCIESALAQTYQRTEVIVVDDCSTDGSREVIRRYPCVVPVFKTANAGQGSALNAGFVASHGDSAPTAAASDSHSHVRSGDKPAAFTTARQTRPERSSCGRARAFQRRRSPARSR